MKYLLLFFVLSASFTSAFAQDLSIEYPELMVTPKASKRLFMEAKKEREEGSNPFSVHTSIQLSGLMTLYAGTNLNSNPDTDAEPDTVANASQVGTMVGAAWLITGLTLHYTYKPYQDGYALIKKLPNKTKRDKLVRERMAEEQLRKAAEHGKKMAWFSFATNFGASAYMATLGSSKANLVSVGAAVLSFLPFIYPYQWEVVYENHQLYKKKIYGPVASSGLVIDSNTRKAVPAINLTWNF